MICSSNILIDEHLLFILYHFERAKSITYVKKQENNAYHVIFNEIYSPICSLNRIFNEHFFKVLIH